MRDRGAIGGVVERCFPYVIGAARALWSWDRSITRWKKARGIGRCAARLQPPFAIVAS
jgi:hypothetical protein